MSGMMDEMRAYFQVWNAAKEDIMLTATGGWVKITNAVFKAFWIQQNYINVPRLLKYVNHDKLVRHVLQIFYTWQPHADLQQCLFLI